MPKKPKLFKNTHYLDCDCAIIYWCDKTGCLIQSNVKLCKQHKKQARLPLPKPLFYVETIYAFGWDDACWQDEEEGQAPVRTLFSSRALAEKDIEHHVKDIRAAVRKGDIQPPGDRRNEFRVVPWDFASKFAKNTQELLRSLKMLSPRLDCGAIADAELLLATYQHSLKL